MSEPVSETGPGASPPQRILVLSAFHPELRHGGSQGVAYTLFRALRAAGEEACFLAAVDDHAARHLPSETPISRFDRRVDEFLFRAEDYDADWHKLCSTPAIEALAGFIADHAPDVIHFHHFLFFGIDALTIARRAAPRAAILLTLHDLTAICPANGCMVRTHDGSLCDAASGTRCHRCLPRHPPDRFEARRLWFMRHLATVDRFVCPSRFVADRHVAWGIAPGRIAVIGNGTDIVGGAAPATIDGDDDRPRNRFGFFGQLIDLKGVMVLLRAAALLRNQGFVAFSVEINGDNLAGASETMRREFSLFMEEEAKLPHGRRLVTDNGAYAPDRLAGRMARIDWCVVPSLWWEAFAMVMSEAWACGVPAICASAGAMAERLTHGQNGLAFALGDEQALARTMRRAATERGLWGRLHAALPRVDDVATMSRAHRALYREDRLQEPG